MRRLAIGSMVVAIIAIVYSFVREGKSKSEIQTAQATSDSLKLQLDVCAAEAQKQQELARQAATEAAIAHNRAIDALKNARN